MMRALSLMLTAALAVSGAAHACVHPADQRPLLHDELPDDTLPLLEEGAIAAEVEIVPTGWADSTTIDARVIRMIAGDFAGQTIRVERLVISSCDSDPDAGTRGILVGLVVSKTDEVLVVDPIRRRSPMWLEEQAAAQASAPR